MLKTVQDSSLQHLGLGLPMEGENSSQRLLLHVLPGLTDAAGSYSSVFSNDTAEHVAAGCSDHRPSLTPSDDTSPSSTSSADLTGSPEGQYESFYPSRSMLLVATCPCNTDPLNMECGRQGTGSVRKTTPNVLYTTEVTELFPAGANGYNHFTRLSPTRFPECCEREETQEDSNPLSATHDDDSSVLDLEDDDLDAQFGSNATLSETTASDYEFQSSTEQTIFDVRSTNDDIETPSMAAVVLKDDKQQSLPYHKSDHVSINVGEDICDVGAVDHAAEEVKQIREEEAEDEADADAEQVNGQNIVVDQDNDGENLEPTDEDLTDEEEKDEEEDEEEEEEEEIKGPVVKAGDIDHGWAFVVLTFAFLGMTIFGTFTFSTGIFQAEILQTVEPDVQKTAWVGASHLSTLCMIGPFAGLIKNKLGSRATVLMSSVIICCGMIAASFSHNVTQLILTYGVITGIGTGLALNPMFVCASFYFERYRSFASGVIAAGSGAGMFVGGPIIRQLIESYGLSGAFLIWGAVGLNIGVAGMVMRPSSVEREKEKDKEMVYNPIHRLGSTIMASVSTLPSAGGYWGSVLGLSTFLVRDKEADTQTLQQSQVLLGLPEREDAINSCNELSVPSSGVMETAARTAWRPRNFRSSQLSMGAHSSYELVIPAAEMLEASARTVWRTCHLQSSQLSVGESLDWDSTNRPRSSPLTVQGKTGPSTGKQKDASSPTRGRLFLCKASWRCTDSLDSFRFVRNPGFLMYLFSASMWVFGESIVFTYLPTYAESQGSSPFQSATLITAVGFTSTFSRLIVGFVAGDQSVGPDLMHVGMLGLCGLFTITFPLYSGSFSGQLVFAAFYGLYSGGLASVINVLTISFIGVEQVALAFGLICFGQGLTSLLGPTIAGSIVSGGGNYGDVFIFSGSLLLVAAVSGFPMVLYKPQPQEMDGDVETVGEATRSVRVRMKGESCHT